MKYTEIKAMSDDDLAKKLEEGRAELFNLRFQMATSQLITRPALKRSSVILLAFRPRCVPSNCGISRRSELDRRR